MKISNDKAYRVEKFTETQDSDYGCLPGSDVKSILRGYKYDAELEMWFSPKGTIGYAVTEIE